MKTTGSPFFYMVGVSCAYRKVGWPSDLEDVLDLPSTPGLYADSIVFIYRTAQGAQRDTGFCAVGCIVSIHSSVRATHRYYYLVTNEHIVRDFDNVTVRINCFGGFKVLQIPRGKFQINKQLDLAIAALPQDSETIFSHVSKEASVNPERIAGLKIGYGTDVFMISRIVREKMHYLKRNIAVMRFGNVALIPLCEEKFYLVEMRSVAGHSGSPVFVYQTPFIFGTPRKQEEEFAPMLLGINRGHLEESTEILREIDGQLSRHPYLRSVTNMAISQVVPAWHIFEMLEGKKFLTQRQKADRKLTSPAKFEEDQFPAIPPGKKVILKQDGSTEIADLTGEEKRFLGFTQSDAQKSEPEP